jgi:CBS domain-containing protein
VFLNNAIDTNDQSFPIDRSTLTININFPIARIQFLFTHLNISHLYVTNKNKLCGIITKDDFIKKSMGFNK